MNALIFTGIEELDLAPARSQGYPGLPAPTFTDLVESDVEAFRLGERRIRMVALENDGRVR